MKRLLWTLVLASVAVPVGATHFAITSAFVKGTSRNVDGKSATSVLLDIEDVGVDAQGNLYAVASYPTRVVKIGSDGIVRTIIGGGNSTPANGLRATDVSIVNTRRMAVDAQGVVYLSDRSRHQIYRVGADGIFNILAGTTSGFAGDGGPATAAKLNRPWDIALDPLGNLYVLDVGNSRIRKITAQGLISTIAGNGSTSYTSGVQAVATGLTTYVNFISADGNGRVYFQDYQYVRVIEPSGLTRTFYGVPLSPYLTGMEAAADGTVYVTGVSEGNPAVLRVSASGAATKLVGTNQQAINGDGGPASAAATAKPASLAVGPNNTLYFVDYQIVRRIATNGTIQTVAGSHSAAAAGEGGSLADSNLREITSVVRDSQGRFYISDNYTESIYSAPADLSRITRIAGVGYPGDTGTAGPGLSIAFDRPTDVELDSAGNLYISDTWNGYVRKLSPAGTISIGAGWDGDTKCTIAKDPDPYCYMEPAGLRFDKSGNLYIADSVNSRVLKLAPGGAMELFAGKGGYGNSGDGGPAVSAQLNWPYAIDFDANGNAYIADFADQRIRKVTPGGTISTFAGTGATGFAGDKGPALSAQFSAPSDVRVLADGSVLVFDARNNRVRSISTTGIIDTVVGGGSSFFANASEGTGAGLTGDSTTSGSLYVDSTGRIWVNDIQRLSWMEPGTIFSNWVVNGASFKTAGVAPGELVTIYGEDIGPASLASATYENGNLQRTVGATRVLFDGIPAALIYVSATQTSALVPYGVSGKTILQVEYQGRKSNAIPLSVISTMPGVFTYSGGSGQIVAVNQDGTFNSATQPQTRGGWMVMFLTGQGALSPGIGDGLLPSGPSYPATAGSFSISVGGVPVSAGDNWNGLIYQGVLQVNFRIPETVPAGTADVRVTIGTNVSQAATVELR